MCLYGEKNNMQNSNSRVPAKKATDMESVCVSRNAARGHVIAPILLIPSRPTYQPAMNECKNAISTFECCLFNFETRHSLIGGMLKYIKMGWFRWNTYNDGADIAATKIMYVCVCFSVGVYMFVCMYKFCESVCVWGANAVLVLVLEYACVCRRARGRAPLYIMKQG